MDIEFIISKIPNKPIPYIDLARLCKIHRDKNTDFSKALFQLVRENKIGKTADSEYFKLIFLKSGKGKFRSNPRGFGFVAIENLEKRQSVFFSPITRKNAIDGDLIEYKTYIDPARDREVGIVFKIIDRINNTIVGLIRQNGNFLDLYPFNQNFGTRIRIVNKKMAKKGHIVSAKVIRYDGKFLIVEIIKDIGHKNDELVDIEGLVLSSHVKSVFPKEVLDVSNKIENNPSESDFIGREDLRNLFTITIDGADSKDFDDAISVEKENDSYILYVHIADVSHYITPGSVMDKEALERGTSIYLPGKVIPMLPEQISNNICSLNPNVDRLTITCKMTVNLLGDVIKTEIFPSIINSNRRTIYNDVNNYLENKEKSNSDDNELEKLLTQAYELSKILQKSSLEKGYIDFEIEEAKIILDEKGKTKQIKILKQGVSEKLIESFMVLANESIAKYIEAKKLPFIYRTHGKPVYDNVQNLKKVINSLGGNVDVRKDPSSKEFLAFVNSVKQYRFDNFIKIMLLRSMSKAEYSKENIGHFGLALGSYTHFTSPIRRYPDLMVHRILREYLFNKNEDPNKFGSDLSAIAKANSNSEVAAKDLERDVIDFKKAEFYEQFVGTTRIGHIVSVNKFGMFIEYPDKVDGLARIETLRGIYNLSEDGLKLISKLKTYSIGDEVNTKIIKVDKFDRKIDLSIISN